MGTITLSKQNRLFWLGRYSERVYGMVKGLMNFIDELIDSGEGIDYATICRQLGIPNIYENSEDFVHRYLFDRSDPASVASAAENMLGNGMVLRETLTTPTLAYLQMSVTALDLARESSSPAVALQWVLDDIMAFRGSCDDSLDDETTRNIVKTGGLVERLSLMLRLGWNSERLEKELGKLMNRIYKTGLPTDPAALEIVSSAALGGAAIDQDALRRSIETLFLV